MNDQVVVALFNTRDRAAREHVTLLVGALALASSVYLSVQAFLIGSIAQSSGARLSARAGLRDRLPNPALWKRLSITAATF